MQGVTYMLVVSQMWTDTKTGCHGHARHVINTIQHTALRDARKLLYGTAVLYSSTVPYMTSCLSSSLVSMVEIEELPLRDVKVNTSFTTYTKLRR